MADTCARCKQCSYILKNFQGLARFVKVLFRETCTGVLQIAKFWLRAHPSWMKLCHLFKSERAEDNVIVMEIGLL